MIATLLATFALLLLVSAQSKSGPASVYICTGAGFTETCEHISNVAQDSCAVVSFVSSDVTAFDSFGPDPGNACVVYS